MSRVRLGGIVGYLKMEHRVPWMERLRNVWAGFGLASKSGREGQTLQRLGAVFSSTPAWIATGETADGRAFLLLRELHGTRPLVEVLEDWRDAPSARLQLARQLGRTLAQLHESGFVHGDLFAPHVLVDTATGQIFFLDWQRARRDPRECWRDLAALSITLPLTLVGRRERRALLVTYLCHRAQRVPLSAALCAIERVTSRLRRRRHVRAKSHSSTEQDRPSLLCLPGGSLRVTPAFLRLWPATLPGFLFSRRATPGEEPFLLPDGNWGRLVRRTYVLAWYQRFAAARRTWASPQRLHMNLLFRLQRFGIESPCVLAEGEIVLAADRVEGLLLTRLPRDVVPLEQTLGDNALRPTLLRETGALLGLLHQSGCGLSGGLSTLGMQRSESQPRIVLTSVERVFVRRSWGRLGRWWDRWRLRRALALNGHAEYALFMAGYRNAEENET